MKLKQLTVSDVFNRFFVVYGMPKHLKTDDDVDKFMKINHRVLSALFTEEMFPLGVLNAYKNAMRFPVVRDFVYGLDKDVLKKPPKMITINTDGISDLSADDDVEITLLEEPSINGGRMQTTMTKRELSLRIKSGEFVVSEQ